MNVSWFVKRCLGIQVLRRGICVFIAGAMACGNLASDTFAWASGEASFSPEINNQASVSATIPVTQQTPGETALSATQEPVSLAAMEQPLSAAEGSMPAVEPLLASAEGVDANLIKVYQSTKEHSRNKSYELYKFLYSGERTTEEGISYREYVVREIAWDVKKEAWTLHPKRIRLEREEASIEAAAQAEVADLEGSDYDDLKITGMKKIRVGSVETYQVSYTKGENGGQSSLNVYRMKKGRKWFYSNEVRDGVAMAKEALLSKISQAYKAAQGRIKRLERELAKLENTLEARIQTAEKNIDVLFASLRERLENLSTFKDAEGLLPATRNRIISMLDPRILKAKGWDDDALQTAKEKYLEALRKEVGIMTTQLQQEREYLISLQDYENNAALASTGADLEGLIAQFPRPAKAPASVNLTALDPQRKLKPVIRDLDRLTVKAFWEILGSRGGGKAIQLEHSVMEAKANIKATLPHGLPKDYALQLAYRPTKPEVQKPFSFVRMNPTADPLKFVAELSSLRRSTWHDPQLGEYEYFVEIIPNQKGSLLTRSNTQTFSVEPEVRATVIKNEILKSGYTSVEMQFEMVDIPPNGSVKVLYRGGGQFPNWLEKTVPINQMQASGRRLSFQQTLDVLTPHTTYELVAQIFDSSGRAVAFGSLPGFQTPSTLLKHESLGITSERAVVRAEVADIPELRTVTLKVAEVIGQPTGGKVYLSWRNVPVTLTRDGMGKVIALGEARNLKPSTEYAYDIQVWFANGSEKLQMPVSFRTSAPLVVDPIVVLKSVTIASIATDGATIRAEISPAMGAAQEAYARVRVVGDTNPANVKEFKMTKLNDAMGTNWEVKAGTLSANTTYEVEIAVVTNVNPTAREVVGPNPRVRFTTSAVNQPAPPSPQPQAPPPPAGVPPSSPAPSQQVQVIQPPPAAVVVPVVVPVRPPAVAVVVPVVPVVPVQQPVVPIQPPRS